MATAYPSNMSVRCADAALTDEALSSETAAILATLHPAILEPLSQWQNYKTPLLFPEIAAAVAASPFALFKRLEHLSNEEGCGAEIIRGLTRVTALADFAAKFDRHAKDEIAHQHSYALLAAELGAAEALGRPALHRVDPVSDLGIDFDQEREHLVLSIHLGEIRNLLNMDLIIPPLASSASPMRRVIAGEMAAIRRDELGHVRYLAAPISEWVDDGRLRQNEIRALIATYDQYWWDDVARAAGDLGAERRNALTGG